MKRGTGYGQGHLGRRSEKWGLKQTNKQTKNRNAGPKAFRMQTIVKNSRTRASLGRSRTGGVEFPRVCNDEVDVNSPGFSGEHPALTSQTHLSSHPAIHKSFIINPFLNQKRKNRINKHLNKFDKVTCQMVVSKNFVKVGETFVKAERLRTIFYAKPRRTRATGFVHFRTPATFATCYRSRH